jgi:hypothetical protein
MAFLLSDLSECKVFCEIDPTDTNPDLILNFLLEMASDWILTWLDRHEIAYGFRTEWYDGKGTQKLVLRTHPMFVDSGRPMYVFDYCDNMNVGNYGAALGTSGGPQFVSGQWVSGTGPVSPLTYGTCYFPKFDTPNPDGGPPVISKCGVLIRNQGTWGKQWARSWGLLTPFQVTAWGQIQVCYWGGYTVDTLPPTLRRICAELVARCWFRLPVGLDLTGDTYQEKTVSIMTGNRDWLMRPCYGELQAFRSWKFGT